MAKMKERSLEKYLFRIYQDKKQLSINLSSYIQEEIKLKLKSKDRFQLCIPGGSTPKTVYQLLSMSSLPWERVDIFLGDERCVSPLSHDSNALMVRNTLLKDKASSANFFQFFEAEDFDEILFKNTFTKLLLSKCSGNIPTFDLTLLGLGDDGHTASLFPYKKNNSDNEFLIFSEGNGIRRISFTPRVFNASKKIVFLVSGFSKQEAIIRLIDKNESAERTPAKLIKSKAKISIFCDEEAYNDRLIKLA